MATEVTAADVKAYAPEFASVADPRVELMIEYGQNFLSETKWKSKFKMGLILITAHLLELGNREGVGGAVTSESAGGMSVSYAAPDSKDALASTSHGQMFATLKRSIATGPLVL